MLASEYVRRAGLGVALLACFVAPRAPIASAARTPPAPARVRGALDLELQRAIFAARDAVLPSLVHVEPIIETFSRGQKSKAAITGSGVIVDDEGHVLTNNHVVAHARRVTCILYDRRELTATVVGRDSFTDLAVLKLDLKGGKAPLARLGQSSTLTAGQHVIAMGSPLGLARSISLGVVSTPDRYFPEDFLPSGEITGTYNTWIQTDAAINPGNSGGPLVNLAGEVIGINARAVPIFGENLGFAIPIDVVKDVAAQIISKGSVQRSWVGVQWQHMKSLADFFGAQDRGGVLVAGVVPLGPAERAGLEAGDVLVTWSGEAVNVRFEEELPAFRKRVADTPIGATVPVVLLRRGQEIRVNLVTELQPELETEEMELESWGLTAKDITPDLARRRRLKDADGVLVTGVKNAAPAAVANIAEGDIIREVGGIRVNDAEQLLAAHEKLEREKAPTVLVRFDRGNTHRVALLEISRD